MYKYLKDNNTLLFLADTINKLNKITRVIGVRIKVFKYLNLTHILIDK